MELSERLKISPAKSKELESYYASLPLLSNDSPLFVLLDHFQEQIWGGKHRYKTVEMTQDRSTIAPASADSGLSDPERSAWDVQILEERYHFENELMAAVEHGQIHKTELIFSSLSSSNNEYPSSQGRRARGVHPVHPDRISSDFAKRIEGAKQLLTTTQLQIQTIAQHCGILDVQYFSKTFKKYAGMTPKEFRNSYK